MEEGGDAVASSTDNNAAWADLDASVVPFLDKSLGLSQKLMSRIAQDFCSIVPRKNQAHSGLCN